MIRRIREFFLLAGWKSQLLVGGLALYLLICILLALWWSREPDKFNVQRNAEVVAAGAGAELVTGYVTVATIERLGRTLLDKPGGYLSNDAFPPTGIVSPALGGPRILDNMPAWEWGVVQQLRKITEAMRYHMSRSQSQSQEDDDLAKAAPDFNNDNERWVPGLSAEHFYDNAIESLASYRQRLADDDQTDAQFYARADNLRAWLEMVEKDLGSLANRLGQSVGSKTVDDALSGDPAAEQSTPTPIEKRDKTPRLQVDNIFYEARGAAWALAHLMQAIEIDFAQVLEKKNATASVQNIIRELESSQAQVWSPIILNGTGFGFTANHSLVMASYISRANAGIIDLRNLLEQG